MEQAINAKSFDTSESENDYVTVDEYCEEFGDYTVVEKIEMLKPDSSKVLDKKDDLWQTSLSPICKSKKIDTEDKNQTMDELMAEVASLCEEPSSVSDDPLYVTLTTECNEARPNSDDHVCNISCGSLACKKHGKKVDTRKVILVSSPSKYSFSTRNVLSSTSSNDPSKSPLSEMTAALLSSMSNKKANIVEEFSQSFLTENRGYTSSGSDELFKIYAGDTSCLDDDMKNSKSRMWSNIKNQTFDELLADVKLLCDHELDDESTKSNVSTPCSKAIKDCLNAQPISKIDVDKIMASTPLPTKKLLPCSTVTSLQVHNGTEQIARKKISYPSLLSGNAAERSSKMLWGSPKRDLTVASIVTETPGRFKGLNITRVVTEEAVDNEEIDEYAEDILGLDTIINTDIDDDDDYDDIDDTILSESSENLDETVIEVAHKADAVSGNALDSTICCNADVTVKQVPVNIIERSANSNKLESEIIGHRLDASTKDASAFLEISMKDLDNESSLNDTIKPIVTTVQPIYVDHTGAIKPKSSDQSNNACKLKIFGKTDSIISKPKDQIAVVKPMTLNQSDSSKSITVDKSKINTAVPLSQTNITDPMTDLNDTDTHKSIETIDIVTVKFKSVETTEPNSVRDIVNASTDTKSISSSIDLATDIKPVSTKEDSDELKFDSTLKSVIDVNKNSVKADNEVLAEKVESDKSLNSLTDCDKPLKSLTDCDQPLKSVTDCDKPKQSVTNCDKPIKYVTNCAKPFKSVTELVKDDPVKSKSIAQTTVILPDDSFIIIDSESDTEKLVEEFVVVDKSDVVTSKTADFATSNALANKAALNASIVTDAGTVITNVDRDGMIVKILLTSSKEATSKDQGKEAILKENDDIVTVTEDKRSILDVNSNLINQVKKRWNTIGVQNPEVNLTTASYFSRRQRKKGLFVKGQLEGHQNSCLALGNNRTNRSKKRKASGDLNQNEDQFGKKQKTNGGLIQRKRWASAQSGGDDIVQSYAVNAGSVKDDLAAQLQKLKYEFRCRIETIINLEDEEKKFQLNSHHRRLRALLMQQNLEVLSMRNRHHYGNSAWIQYQLMQLDLEHLNQKHNLERNHNYEFNDLDKKTRKTVSVERDKFVAKENQLLSLQRQIESRNATAQDGDFMVSVNVKKGPCRTNKQTISFVPVCLPAAIASHMMAADDIIDSFYLYTV